MMERKAVFLYRTKPFRVPNNRIAQKLLCFIVFLQCLRTQRKHYFVKWLVAVIANAMDDLQCRNHTCLVLTGEQGKFKTEDSI